MNSNQVKEMLEKQLQLLSERSKECSSDEQMKIIDAMLKIGRFLLEF